MKFMIMPLRYNEFVKIFDLMDIESVFKTDQSLWASFAEYANNYYKHGQTILS